MQSLYTRAYTFPLPPLFIFVSPDNIHTPSYMNSDWFESLINDCKAISVEYGFTSRWSNIEGRHELGKRILQENDNFKRQSIYGLEVVKKVANALGTSERTVQYAVQFAQKCPELNELPYGKDVTWTRIIKEYLPENPIPQEKKVKTCPFCNHILP